MISVKLRRTIKRMFLFIAEHIPVPFGKIRMTLYKLAGLKMDKGVTIGYGVQICGSFEDIYLSENVEIAQGVYLHAYDKITIGRNTSIAPFVKIITNQNPNLGVNKLTNYYKPLKKPVIIDDNVYIGTGAIILPGVNIHEMSVVAAGAVVTKEVPPYTVVAGVPARVVKCLKTNRLNVNRS